MCFDIFKIYALKQFGDLNESKRFVTIDLVVVLLS